MKALRPAVPTDDGKRAEFGRCFTPGHSAYMRECRWCLGPLHVQRGVLFCPRCDRLHAMTGKRRPLPGTRQEGTTA